MCFKNLKGLQNQICVPVFVFLFKAGYITFLSTRKIPLVKTGAGVDADGQRQVSTTTYLFTLTAEKTLGEISSHVWYARTAFLVGFLIW